MNELNLSFKSTTLNFLYLGAVLCGLIAIATIYQITLTRNTSIEYIVWIYVVLGFVMLGLGYVYESKNKKKGKE